MPLALGTTASLRSFALLASGAALAGGMIVGLPWYLACFGLFAVWWLDSRIAPRFIPATSAAPTSSLSSTESAAFVQLSHEVRAPLSAILGYADLLAETLDSPDAFEAATTIQRHTRHLLELVNDSLDLSRLQARGLEPNYQQANPGFICRDIVRLFAQQAQTRSITIKAECSSEANRSVLIDTIRFRQIVTNLTTNALKFTEEGEVVVSIDVIGQTEVLGKTPGDRRLVVRVTDTGIGMSPEQQARIFMPFAQADSGISKRYGGTGLGLSIARALAESLGGSLTLSSAVGKGTTFRLEIPFKELGSDTSEGEIPTEHGVYRTARGVEHRAGMRVLLADDSIDNRRLYGKLLALHGCDTKTVEDGHEAILAALESGPFDLVLMDVHMPGCDGLKATRELRGRGYEGKIYALTASTSAENQRHCLLAGFDGHLPKPISREKLDEFLRVFQRPTETALVGGSIPVGASIPVAKDSGSSPDPK